MLNLLCIPLLCLVSIFACKAPSERETHQNPTATDSSSNEVEHTAPAYVKKALRSLTVVGDFNGDGTQDTLKSGFYATDGQSYIEEPELPSDLTWDSMIVWFDKQHIQSVVKSTQPKLDTLAFVNSFGLYCLINLGDLNGDKSDELALVNDRLDMTRLNQCYVYSHCSGKWQLMKTFEINEDAFDFIGDEQPAFKLISGYLEPRGKKWFYKDALEEAVDSEAELGQMKELRIERCKR